MRTSFLSDTDINILKRASFGTNGESRDIFRDMFLLRRTMSPKGAYTFKISQGISIDQWYI